MANDTVIASSLDAISLERYPGGSPYWSQINQKAEALDLIESTNVIPFMGNISDGRFLAFPVRKSGSQNAAVGAGELSGEPTPGRQATAQLRTNVATHWETLELTGLVMDTIDGGDALTIDALTLEMREQQSDARSEMNWIMHQTGGGTRAICSTNNAGISLTVASVDQSNVFSVAIIPHTFENTNLRTALPGDRVN